MRNALTVFLLLSPIATASVPKGLLAALAADGDTLLEEAVWLESPALDTCLATLEKPGAPVPEACRPGPGDTVLGISADGNTLAQWGGVMLDDCAGEQVPTSLRLVDLATGKVAVRTLSERCPEEADADECDRRALLPAWRAVQELQQSGFRPVANLVTRVAWDEGGEVHMNAPLAALGGSLDGQLLYARRGAQLSVELVDAKTGRGHALGRLRPAGMGARARPTVAHVSVHGRRLVVLLKAHDGSHCSPSTPLLGRFTLPKGLAVEPAPLVGAPESGPADAPLTLVEVSDFQCPYCARASVTLEALERRYGKSLRRVFKNNPLSFHKQARGAALAALAAHQQGKFWSYRRRLFDNQRALTDADLERYAQQEELDLARFRRDLARPELAAQVDNEQRSAVHLGLTGTPSFLVNGRLVRGAQPEAAFVEVMDAELAAMQELTRTGLSVAEARALRVKANLGDKASLYTDNLIGGREAPPAAPLGSTSETPPVDPTVWRMPVRGDEPTLGRPDALVTAVALMDLECPFCARHFPNLLRLAKENPEVRLVFKHTPLAFHTHAQGAARAAVAAHAQGAFWPFVERAFGNTKALSDADLEAHAEALGLDLPRFRTDRDAADPVVARDAADAEALNARGTPQLYVNGRSLRGAQPYEALAALVSEEQKKAEARVAAGTPRAGLYEALQQDAKVFEPLEATAHALSDDGEVRLGEARADGVTLTVFVDYQCPFSARLQDVLRQLVEDPESAGRLSVVFKHFPLSFHPHAEAAALAVIAAQLQGQGLALHRALFERSAALTPDDIRQASAALDLDDARFERDRASAEAAALLARDKREAQAAELKGTPQLYLDGRKILGSAVLGPLRALIVKALADKGASPR